MKPRIRWSNPLGTVGLLPALRAPSLSEGPRRAIGLREPCCEQCRVLGSCSLCGREVYGDRCHGGKLYCAPCASN